MALGGDVVDITFSNADVGTGTFRAKAGEGNSYDTGGIRNMDNKSITSGGTRIVSKNRVPGFFQVLIENDMNVNKDVEKLAQLAASTSLTTWTFSVINGKTYRGIGDVVGDITADIDKATVPLRVEAPAFAQI